MRRLLPYLLLLVALLTALPAAAATLAVQGALRTQAGGPAADGNYVVVAALYDAADAKTHLWQELIKQVPVQGGVFALDLGAAAPIPDALLTAGQPLWLGVQVGGELELPRVPLRRVAHAFHAAHAALAQGLQCTGCVQAGHLATGAVQSQHVAFAYAGAQSKGGPADEALHAKAADLAKLADKATAADTAKLATTAESAQELQCSGCVAPGHLAPQVSQLFLSSQGGTVDGGLVVAKDLQVQGKAAFGQDVQVAGGLRFGAVAADCTAELAGVVRFADKHLQVCDGSAWKQLDNAPMPQLLSVSPTFATTAGGQVLTLTGANFTAGVTVTIGGIKAGNVNVLSNNKIEVTLPAFAAGGAKDVAVIGPDGTQALLVGALQIELTGLLVYYDAARKESWPGSGDQWLDLSGNAVHAKMVGGLAFGNLGGIPTMVFNGSGAGAQFPNAKLHTQKMTAVYWVYSQLSTSNTGQGGLYVNRASVVENTPDYVWFGKYDADVWYFRVNNGSCCNDLVGSGGASWNGVLPPGQWRMVHFGFEVGASNGWKWGVNGQNVATAKLAARPASQSDPTSTIGFGHSGPGAYWKGGIASVRFYDRLLADAELQAEFLRLKAQYGL